MGILILHHKMKEELSEKEKELLRNKITKHPSSLPELPEQQNLTSGKILKRKKKVGMRLWFLKRISPFLLLELFLAGLFPYMMITRRGPIHNEWLLLFLFIFIEANILFIDFAIWNYFKGKKIFRIWLIEVFLTFLIIHFLI
ncbi:MAG TPA: hypothetical protein VN958_11380 [Chitinophagaceae bacterium]|nr:hypothetical protein [Chitinophagaceae bacterium]